MHKLIHSIKKYSKSYFLKNISIVFSETMATKALSFFLILTLTKCFSPELYGQYSFVFILIMFSAAFFDFGMENTAVVFSAKGNNSRDSIFGLYAFSKFIILSIICACLFMGKDILFNLFNKPNLTQYMGFILAGIVGESLFFINDTYLQSVQKFKLRAFLNISNWSLKLIYILGLFITHHLTLQNVFYIFIIPLVLSVFFIKNYFNFIKSFLNSKIKDIKEIFKYQKWMTNLAVANNILPRVDIFMISVWFGFKEIGLYNAAFQLSSIVSFLPFVLGKVMLPKISEYSKEEIPRFVSKAKKLVLGCSLLIILALPFVDKLIHMFLGAQYVQSIAIFNILVVGAIFSFLATPFEQGLYALGKPKIISINKYVQIFLLVILNVMFLRNYGIEVAAINIVVSRFLYLCVISVYFSKQTNIVVDLSLAKEQERDVCVQK